MQHAGLQQPGAALVDAVQHQVGPGPDAGHRQVGVPGEVGRPFRGGAPGDLAQIPRPVQNAALPAGRGTAAENLLGELPDFVELTVVRQVGFEHPQQARHGRAGRDELGGQRIEQAAAEAVTGGDPPRGS